MYYVDGYNLLFSLIEEKSVETSRLLLVDLLADLLTGARIQATLIFDSHSDLSTQKPSAAYRPFLQILFSPRGLCADRYILELLQGLHNTRLATVVTADTALAKNARLLGAHILPNEEFLQLLSKKTKKKPEQKPTQQGKKELERLRIFFEERYKNGNHLDS
jgi:predicted RNA-binding protein with PIN domain